MKRLWVGIILLLILLAGTLAVTVAMDRIYAPMVEALEAGDLEAAEERYGRWRDLTAAFADHGPMEEMDSLFARAEVCGDEQERKALCAELAQRARAMSNAHSPTWWNLL